MKARLAILIALSAATVAFADDELDKILADVRSRNVAFTPYSEKYRNGQLRERGLRRYLGIVCGKAWTDYDGLREGWYESGVKECEIHYKGGDRDGVALNWFPNGKKKYAVTWSKGKRDGAFAVYYDSEVVSARGRFKEEVLAQAEFFDREGKRVTKEQWLAIAGNRSFWN